VTETPKAPHRRPVVRPPKNPRNIFKLGVRIRREATAIRRQLDRIGPIGYVVTSLPTGEIAFVFPDLPVRVYRFALVRAILRPF
jgi:hypothetical protein